MPDPFWDDFDDDDLLLAYENTAFELMRRGLPVYPALARAKARQIMLYVAPQFEDFDGKAERPN